MKNWKDGNPDKKLFHERMNDIIIFLEKRVDISEFDALEVFGRAGDWHTIAYANRVKSLQVWEIDKKWKNTLKKNLPNAKIKIQNSIKTISENLETSKFDLIVIDNPMNTWGTKKETNLYCEHFDFIKHIGNIIDKEAILIFNVNKNPFDYDKFPEWKKRREKFYERKRTSKLSLRFLILFYKKLFLMIGYKTIFQKIFKRNEYTDYFVFFLRKN